MREIPADRLDVLTELREICLQTLRGFRESMEYGMPTFIRNNQAEVAFNNQKEFISLFIMNEAILKKYKQELKSHDVVKNSIRFKSPSKMDFELITKLLQEVVENPLTSN